MLSEKGWSEKSAGVFTGVVRNASGQERYKLKGRWNEEVFIEDCQNRQEKSVWRIQEQLGDPYQYGYDEFMLNLNHLNEELACSVAATDTRLRPD